MEVSAMGEAVGAWVRVSSGKQDEQNQEPDIERYCSAHDYSIVRRYTLHDKSASKGEQQEKLDQMLADMRDGTIKILVCWHSDRLERREPAYVYKLLAQVKDAGGHIESVQEPTFGGQDFAGQVTTAVGAVIAHEKSKHLADQVKLAHNRIRANGAVGPGGTPWGYKTVGPKYGKTLVPTDLCREYVPQIFDRAIAGETCRSIAVWLDAEGVPPKRGDNWHEGTVRKLIHNRVYAGRWQNESKTQTLTKCEAVITAATFDKAQTALRTREHTGPRNLDNQPLLAKLRCARCDDSPMFRIRLRNSQGKLYWYYRCTGRGARRKGCGNMVPYELTNNIVSMVVELMTDQPYQVRTWVEGHSWDSEISEVKQDMREALEAEDFARLPELQHRLEDLRNREVTKGHWESEDSDATVGEHFASLDRDGQREYLATRDIRAEKAPKSDVPGVRLVLDGKDLGIIRYEKA
jgi:DNA invertase Pin-like site-specific DNA recombinase